MTNRYRKTKNFIGVFLFLALVLGLFTPSFNTQAAGTILVDNLQPSWDAPGGGGVYSAYYGPGNGYIAVSPGSTTLFDGREAGIIKAGLTIDPDDDIFEDEGLFGFKPDVTIDVFAAGPLSYDVQNQAGVNPVWMTIEIDINIVGDRSDNIVYQYVPAPYSSGWNTVDAAAGLWQAWTTTGSGIPTGSLMTLAEVATAHTGSTVIRAYLRLGMGDSYSNGGTGTIAWVDKVILGAITYDFETAKYWYVATTGSDTNTGTEVSPFLTIQHAIDSASAGDTIHVAPGTYDGTLDIDTLSDLTIIGDDPATTIIRSSTTLGWNIGGYTTNRTTVLRVVNSTDITISDLTFDMALVKGNNVFAGLYFDSTGSVTGNIFKNNQLSDAAGGYYEIGLALRAPGYTDAARAAITVDGNTFENGGRVSLLVHDFVDATITDNTFYKTEADFGYAIELGSQSTGLISGNTIYGFDTPAASDGSNSAGIYVENAFTYAVVAPAIAKNVTITDNEIYDSQWGVYIGNEFDGYAGNVDIAVTFTDNDIHDNTDGGVHIADEDKSAGSSVTLTGGNNTLTDNGGYGYYITTAGDGAITVDLTGETITGHATGVYIEDTGTSSTSTYNISINTSDLSGNTTYGVNNTVTGLTVDMTENWWGSSSGPAGVGIGTGSPVSSGVAFLPYYLDAAMTQLYAPVYNVTQDVYYLTIAEAVDAAVSGDTINVNPGTHIVSSQVNFDVTNLTLTGIGDPLIQVSGTGERFFITASGVTLQDLTIEKTDKTGVQNIIYIGASNTTIQNNTIFGHFVIGEGDVSRAMVFTGGLTGVTITGNTIYDLRQPGYISGVTTGTISNNYVYRTKGWVLEGGNMTFTNNTWGTGLDANVFDIAILATVGSSYYTDVPAMSAANNDAFIEDQRTTPFTLSIVYVDGSVPDGGTGTATSPVNTITKGIARVVTGGKVIVAAGTYVENVVINKSLELMGAGATTIVMPAVSAPNPCTGSSMCGGLASNVILVQTNNVIIHDLTVDGDNPALTSGIVRNGADLDARNGIIKNTDATYNNLEVYNVTVQNIYLRGMYSTGGSFNFHDNTVTNVAGDGGSIAMFGWGGPGIMADNVVSYANDAISANHSSGIQFLDNTVTFSGSGVHTDNSGDAGGVADLIQGNNVDCTGVANAYGIWTFVPYVAPTVDNNTVTNCAVGLSAWGQGAAVTTQFTNNTATGDGSAGSVGVYITTDLIGWGYTDVSVLFSSNIITGFETGIYLTADQQSWNTYPYSAQTIDATFHLNQIYGNTYGADMGTSGTYIIDVERNWWGDASGPGPVAFGTGDSIVAGYQYNYTPWCTVPDCSSLSIDPISPSGTLTAWDKSYQWTGVSGASWYVLEVYNASNVRVTSQWINATTYCSGLSCSYVIPSFNLANGDYYWRIRDVTGGIYGTWTGYTEFTLNLAACYTLNLIVNPTGGGTITADIPQNCTGGYLAGTVVQSTAAANPGYSFFNWTGSVSSTSSPVSVVMGGNRTVYANFASALTTGLPNGLMTSWDKSYNWTGVIGSTWYVLEVYDASDILLTTRWISAATYCPDGTTCSFIISNYNLDNGSYKWRVRNVKDGAYQPWSPFTSFTLNIGAVGSQIILGSPSGTVYASSWDRSFNWTGITGSSWYVLEVYNTSGTLLTTRWISASTYCGGGITCSYIITNYNFPNGDYRWRLRNVKDGAYGLWSVLQDFTIAP